MNQAAIQLRSDLAFIADWVRVGAHVLDVGCGDGAMLSYLQQSKHCSGYGIEPADEQVLQCTKRGINVIQQDSQQGLAMFGDNTFDCVLCLSSLQVMLNVEPVLREIARVGVEAIVSFPNFAYWSHRLSLLLGKMPISKLLPHAWYNTPNVRYATIYDFENLAAAVGLSVLDCVALHDGKPVTTLPNWRGSLAVFRLTKT